MDGSCIEQLESGLLGYGRTLFPDMPYVDDANKASIHTALKLHLANPDHRGWLIVVDDLHLHPASAQPSIGDLDQWIPNVGHGSMLITSVGAVSGANNVCLGSFNQQQCLDLIQGRLNYQLKKGRTNPFQWNLAEDLRNVNMLDFLSSSDGLVEGLPLVVDSFACLLAMDAHAEFGTASQADDRHMIDLKEKQHHILHGAIDLFTSSLRNTKNLPGNPRHLLGPMGSLQLWLGRIAKVDPHLIMVCIAQISCLLGPAFPESLLKVVLSTMNFNQPIDILAELEKLRNYGGFIRQDVRGEEVGAFATIVFTLCSASQDTELTFQIDVTLLIMFILICSIFGFFS